MLCRDSLGKVVRWASRTVKQWPWKAREGCRGFMMRAVALTLASLLLSGLLQRLVFGPEEGALLGSAGTYFSR